MLLTSLIPHLPSSIAETWIFIGAALCIILLIYAVFIEKEHRQDIIRFVGTGGLLVYAIYIDNIIFTLAMGGIALASLIEFVEIFVGLHKHSPSDLAEYKKYTRTKHIPNKDAN